MKLRRGRRLLGDNPGADLLQLPCNQANASRALLRPGQRPVDLAHLAAARIDGAASHVIAASLSAPNPRKLGFIRDHIAPALDPLDASRPVSLLRRLVVVVAKRLSALSRNVLRLHLRLQVEGLAKPYVVTRRRRSATAAPTRGLTFRSLPRFVDVVEGGFPC